ncbi:MAG: 50S ribosomal protein L33 [Candidatus Brocadiae bacterium]|nr:50S ribosomal protein L33 [Candidatus Brocadiia bacterium]
MREYVTLECTQCRSENYRTSANTGGGKRLELKKHCPRCRKHTAHRQKRR